MYEERSIQLTQFLSSRADEIQNFTSILESKYLNANKFPYQILHKHLRRRAMSHNRYRIPSQLRNQMNTDNLQMLEDQQKPVKCRKHIRKVKLLQCSYQRRARKILWLETHLHQAKRMKMIDYYGFKVAEKANEKNWRAVHRYESHGCCVNDVSYYVVFHLKDDQQKLEKFISQQTNTNEDQLTGRLPIEFMLKNHNQQLIGPATIIINSLNRSQAMLIIHPAMEAFVKEYLAQENFMFEIKKAEISIFQFYGPQAVNTLDKLIKQLCKNSEDLKQIGFNQQQINLLDFFLSNTFRIQSEPEHQYKAIKTFDDYDDDFNIGNQIPYQSSSNLDGKFWDFNIEEKDKAFSTRFNTLNRSRYTHRKKRKQQYKILQKEKQKQEVEERKIKQQEEKDRKKQGLPPIPKETIQTEDKQEVDENLRKKAIRWLLNEKITLQNNNQQIEEEIIFQQAINIKCTQKDISLLIIPPSDNPKSQFSQGYKLMINMGQGLFVWKLLNRLKLKPIGLRDVRQLSAENQIPMFPNDFPNSICYQEYNKQRSAELLAKELKRPPSKRVNHFVLRFPTPYGPNLSLLKETLTQITLKSFKGIPKEGALIVRPNRQDLDQYLEGKHNIEYEKLEQNQDIQKNTGTSNEEQQKYVKDLLNIKTDRAIIGFITYGNFSNKHASGFGMGFIDMDQFQQGFLVLYRNIGSPIYYFGECYRL